MTSTPARRPVHYALWAVVLLLMELPALPCGPDWPEAVFVKRDGPDAPYTAFVAGKLGVPQAGYRVRHLVVLYNYLSERPLAASEQQAAVDADAHFNSTWMDEQRTFAVRHPGYETWLKARLAFGKVDDYVPPDLGDVKEYQIGSYFDVCFQDAFATAAQTLAAREAMSGSHSPDVAEWVRGQDVVFQACSGTAASFRTLPATAPVWLRQDRAYQLPAAKLYLSSYDEAAAGFRAVAADIHSPWRPLARYLVIRVLVAQALSVEGYVAPAIDPTTGLPVAGQPTPEQSRAGYFAKLRDARTELLSIRPDPQLAPYRHAIDSLLDRVNARLDPSAQLRRLAARLTAPDPEFRQDLIDFTFLKSEMLEAGPAGERVVRPDPRDHVEGGPAGERADDLLQFVYAMHMRDRATSLTRWHKLQTTPWLIASLALSSPGDPGLPELLEAAKSIPPSSPAWTAATYYRLRFSPGSASQVREALLAAQPRLRALAPSRSTTNLFLMLEAQTAPDFQTWLKHAARRPADQMMVDEDEWRERTLSTMPCSGPLPDEQIALFDTDAATILNTRIPLRLLVEAARSPSLPAHLRFTVAQSAWTRAVLLNRPADARRLTPLLEHCSSLWRPILETYDHAAEGPDREAAALFALMRFPSTEPRVREGNLRDPGFPLYSMYRDNWWTFPVSQEGGWRLEYREKPSVPPIPDPAFLTAAEKHEAAAEYAVLDRLPDAPTYFFKRTIAWQRVHPRDPRTPDLLGEAFRVARNGSEVPSRSNDDPHRVNYEQQLYRLLHRDYPNSPWTRRYTVWDKHGD